MCILQVCARFPLSCDNSGLSWHVVHSRVFFFIFKWYTHRKKKPLSNRKVKQKEVLLQHSTLFQVEIWSLSIDCASLILNYAVHFRHSRLPHADGMSGRHDGQVWDLGYRGAGAVPQPCAHVLQGSPGCHRGVWHHQHSKWLSDASPLNPVCQVRLMICFLWDGGRTWLAYCQQSYAKCHYPCFVVVKDTFTRAKNWVKELQRQASPNIVIALAGNKADLANKRAVDLQVIANYDNQWGIKTDSLCNASVYAPFTFYFIGSTSVRRRQQFAVYGNLSQDCNECQWDFYGNRWVNQFLCMLSGIWVIRFWVWKTLL